MTRKTSLLRLWLVTAALWVAALLLRLGRPPSTPILWLGLLAPPLVLAAVLVVIGWFPMLLRPRGPTESPPPR